MDLMKISDVTIDGIVNNQLVSQLPELYELGAVVENNEWHNSQDVLSHTLQVAKSLQKSMEGYGVQKYLCQKIGSYRIGELLFLSAIFHDIAKKETLIEVPDKSWNNSAYASCPSHERVGAEKVVSILQRFDLSVGECGRMVEIIKNHGRPHALLDKSEDISADDKEAMLIFREYPDFKQEFTEISLDLLLLGRADMLGSHLAANDRQEFKRRISLYDRLLDV